MGTLSNKKPGDMAVCPHCSHPLADKAPRIGTLHVCANCGKRSFSIDELAKPIAIVRERAEPLTVADLPAPDANGVIRLDGWYLSNGLDLRNQRLIQHLELRNCLIELTPSQSAAIDLHGAELGGSLEIHDCVLKGRLDLHHARIAGKWRMSGLIVLGDIEAPSLQVFGETRWWNVKCAGQANFYDSQFHENCLMRQSTFTGEANFNDVKIMGEGNFSYSNFETNVDFGVSDFREGAEFFGTRFGGKADFTDLSVVYWADFTASQFFGDVFFSKAKFRDGAEFSGVTFHRMADFIQAEFEADCWFTQVVANGPLEFDHAKFGGRADFRHSKMHANADFRRARFGHIAYFQGSRMRGTLMFVETDFTLDLRMDGVRIQMVDDDDIDRPSRVRQGLPIDFSKAHIGGKFVLDNAHVNCPILLDGLELEDNFNARNAIFHGELSLVGATVDGCFRWNGAVFHAPVRLAGALIGAGILARDVRAYDLWDWTGTRVTGPTLFQNAVFTGRNEFALTEFRGRFDISNATFTEKVDLLGTKFDANLVLDGLRAEHLLISRKQVENHLQNEVFAKHGKDLGKYWHVVAREYAILKRSFAMQTQYADMDWAHLRYCQAHRRYRTFQFFYPAERTDKDKPWKWWFMLQRNGLEHIAVDLGAGYGTRPLRVLVAMAILALLFVPVYLGTPQDAILGNELQEPLDFIDSLSVSLGAQIGVGTDNFALNLSGWQRFFALLEVFLGVGLVTLFISTLSRKMVQ